MADQHTLFRDAFLQFKISSRLPDHLPNGCNGVARIIINPGQQQPLIIKAILEIRQINIHQTVQHSDHIGRFIPPAIINKGKCQPLLTGNEKGFDDSGQLRRRGHQVNIMATLLL